MTRYVCRHCRFRCDLKIESECPYCGRKTLEKEKSAGELLDEIGDVLLE